MCCLIDELVSIPAPHIVHGLYLEDSVQDLDMEGWIMVGRRMLFGMDLLRYRV
jgi:hypothetical protein